MLNNLRLSVFHPRTIRTQILVVAVSSLVYGLLIANWKQEWLRFSSPSLNYAFMVLVFAVPILPLRIAWASQSRVFKVLASVVLIPVTAASGILLFGLILIMTFWVPSVVLSNVDRSFERLRQEQIGDKVFSVYRTNDGALSAFGIVVRQEQMILPGLLRVKPVCSWYPASEVDLTRIDTRMIRCDFLGTTKQPADQQFQVF